MLIGYLYLVFLRFRFSRVSEKHQTHGSVETCLRWEELLVKGDSITSYHQGIHHQLASTFEDLTKKHRDSRNTAYT
ncbi:hypothetical protein HF086_007602, partial [Spodoptera exigua]